MLHDTSVYAQVQSDTSQRGPPVPWRLSELLGEILGGNVIVCRGPAYILDLGVQRMESKNMIRVRSNS
jgi:hypothetical protein